MSDPIVYTGTFKVIRQIVDWINNYTPSGGSGYNYTTDEQIVGTYLGKTLYQKTYVFDSSFTVGSNTWTNTPIPNTNIDSIVDVIAYYSGSVFKYFGANRDVGNHVQFIQTRNSAQIIDKATIQYTKNTD